MAFINKSNVRQQFAQAETYMRAYFEPFDEFERIARNEPSDLISKDLPNVTDGTMAAIIQEQPKRIIQDTATGVVESSGAPELADLATSVLENILNPNSNTTGTPLQKSWVALSKSLTYGVQPSYTFLTETAGVVHTDFILPYIRDVFLERGKTYGPDCNVIFLRSWYTKRDVEAIIEREEDFKKLDKTYKSDWNLVKLRGIAKNGGGGKDEEAKSPEERVKSQEDDESIAFITAFQKGKGGKFLTFTPGIDGILKTRENKDPRGEIPIQFLYANLDGSNPLGRGSVELSGGVQNLIDQQMSMFQFMTTMMMGPPLQVWGNVNKNRLRLAPNQIWDMGANPNNKIEPYSINNQAIANFPNNYGLLKSQILNLNSNMDTSISSEVGNPGFSKTPAGVRTTNARVSIADNYMRKQYEAWYSDVQESELNIYFGEMEGTGAIPITDEMRKNIDEKLIEKYTNEDGELEVKFEDFDETFFTFTVDASSSRKDEDEQRAEKLVQIIQIASLINNPAVQAGVPKLFNRMLKAIGIEDANEIFPDEIVPDNPPVQIEQAKIQNQNAGQPQQQAPPQPQPQVQAVEDAPLTQEEVQFAQVLSQQGFTDAQIEQAILMTRAGAPPEEVVRAIGGTGA